MKSSSPRIRLYLGGFFDEYVRIDLAREVWYPVPIRDSKIIIEDEVYLRILDYPRYAISRSGKIIDLQRNKPHKTHIETSQNLVVAYLLREDGGVARKHVVGLIANTFMLNIHDIPNRELL